MHGHKSWVTCVAFSGNDEMVVTGSRDKSIIRWSTANGQQIGEPLIQNASIESTSISADGKVIVSSSVGGGFCRWDAINGRLLGESVSKEGYGDVIATDDDFSEIVSCSDAGTIRNWRVRPEGTIHEISALSVPADITACAIDMNHSVAGLWSGNGAVGVCDIHEQFDSVGAV